MGSGASAVSVEFECINFHEIVFFAPAYPTQTSFQGVCLYVDDAKTHCWSDTRETVPYDRLVGSNKGQMIANAKKIELRWPEGSEAEVAISESVMKTVLLPDINLISFIKLTLPLVAYFL